MHLEFEVSELEWLVALGLDETVCFWIRQWDDRQWDGAAGQVRAACGGVVFHVHIQDVVVGNVP